MVQVWSAILIVAGALILALELSLPASPACRCVPATPTDAAVTRRGLAGTLRAAATGVDGISSAAVRVRRRRARVTAVSAARGRPAADALKEPVTQALRGRLDDLDLRHPPRLTVRVTDGAADARRPHQPRRPDPVRPAGP